MYTLEISDRIHALECKSKKALKTTLENVCPPMGLKYPSIEWLIEKLKMSSQVKLQNMPNYIVIRKRNKPQAEK